MALRASGLPFWLGVVVDRLAKELADSATAKLARALRAALPLSSRGGQVSRTGHADPIQPF